MSHSQIVRVSIGPANANNLSLKSGFTLIELVVTLAIITVLATITLVRVASYFQQVNAMRAITTLRQADAQARKEASRLPNGRIHLRLDLARQKIAIDGTEWTRSLPTGSELVNVLIRDASLRIRPMPLQEIVIPVQVGGTTMSYAVELRTDRGSRWCVFFGLSGQSTVCEERIQMEQLL